MANHLIVSVLQIIIFVASFLTGIFHEWQCAGLTVLLLGLLLVLWKRKGKITICVSPVLLFLVSLSVTFAFSYFLAVDRFGGFLGMTKFLPLMVFYILICQFADKNEFLDTIPLSGTIMVIISAVLSSFPFGSRFLVSGRLAGFFGYPNSFASFLTAGLSLTLFSSEYDRNKTVKELILSAGIILTESRSAIAILIAIFLVYFLKQNKKKKIFSFIGIAALCVISIGVIWYSGRSINPFQSSTFLGRILYWKDALPQIIKHPFGLGYNGYYYTQGSFQTGVYSVSHVHNDLLQIFLDAGWVPGILAIWSILWVLLSKNLQYRNKLTFIVIVLHALFDFDMQFIVMGMIAILCMPAQYEKIITLKKKSTLLYGSALIVLFSVWTGSASVLNYLKKYDEALKVFPGYTSACIQKLIGSSEDEMEEIADAIISNNRYVSIAYSAKARAAFKNGDIASMIEQKEKALSLNRYSQAEYDDYAKMLKYAYSLYEAAGDKESSKMCVIKLNEINETIQRILDQTDKIAWQLDEKPELYAVA